MKEGCQLSYEFLADNGEKEVRADGGIFEPLYYQVDVEKPSSPSEAFQFQVAIQHFLIMMIFCHRMLYLNL